MKEQLLISSKIVLVSFVFSTLIMFLMRKVAVHVGAIDRPTKAEGQRHIHKREVAKLGGVGIFLAFLFGYMLFGEQSVRMNSILIGSFIIILTSIVDDINSIKASYKLLGHLVAASVIVFYGKITLTTITALGFYFDFGWAAYPITIFFLVACTNIINLIDGLDGLSGGICSIFFATMAIIALVQGRYTSLMLCLSLIMLGSTLGFLVHNFYPAKIFAGDAATFLGFIIGIITLLDVKGPALISFFVPVAILGIPILDTLFAIIRRLLKGQPPFKADRQHIHHQLLGITSSQLKTVLIIYGIDLLFALATIFYVLIDKTVGVVIYIIILIIFLWFILFTTIISDNNPKMTKKTIDKIIGVK